MNNDNSITVKRFNQTDIDISLDDSVKTNACNKAIHVCQNGDLLCGDYNGRIWRVDWNLKSTEEVFRHSRLDFMSQWGHMYTVLEGPHRFLRL